MVEGQKDKKRTGPRLGPDPFPSSIIRVVLVLCDSVAIEFIDGVLRRHSLVNGLPVRLRARSLINPVGVLKLSPFGNFQRNI